MSTLRELKTRIGSVSSSEKITGAMKMISSAKVHKSERDLRRLLPFKNQIKSIIGHLLAADGDYTSPLTEEREVSKVGIVVFGSDDGLCGAYNVNIFKQMLVIMNNYREQYGDSTTFTVFPVGKKMLKAVKKIDGGFISVKSVKGVDSKMTGDKVTEFTEELKHAFISGELDKVIVVYMNFKSISRQILTEEQLFPVEASALGGELDAKSANKLYIFEPDGNRIFNEVLPMFVLSTMQEITIENRASEQAARIMAMQSANDNAKKLLESLRLEYNKLRQQSITTELLDILGGQVEK
jgi:F-type H+-transporting ATPase subunit gamma